MLSKSYREIKRLRSSGKCAAAITLLSASPPGADEDALEAAVCLLVCGQVENAVHVCQTYAWKAPWARQITHALADTLLGRNDAGALSFARSAIVDATAPLDASAIYLLILQKHGLLEEAGAHLRRWRDPVPGETFLMTMVAELAVATKDWRQAYRFACGVLAGDPDDVRALLATSIANYEDGNYHESLGNAQRAQAISGGSATAILQIMRCHNQLGDHYATLGAFGKLVDRDAVAPAFHVELGKAYSALERPSQAIAAYQAALACEPRPIEAIRELAAIHAVAGNAEQLEALVSTYAAEIRNDIEATYWCGLHSLNSGDRDEAAARFRESLEVSDSKGESIDGVPWPVPEPRLRHDYEQLDLLKRRAKLSEPGLEALHVLQHYYDATGDTSTSFAPVGAAAQELRRALGVRHHVPDMPFAQDALGANDYGAIEAKYLAERLVVIDNFLAPEALAALRTFCEEATIWKSYNRHGYVGSLVALGFSPRVLLAIADELRHAMPRVIGDEPLLQAWAYKYDQRMQGINLHADFAKINANFWITPDSACADPTSGGMIVYDIPVPRSWTFADYNRDPARLEAYVKLHGAKPLRVPYRENRCVLFDSSLIHATDAMSFKPGYENRRVNVTLLYGQGLSVE